MGYSKQYQLNNNQNAQTCENSARCFLTVSLYFSPETKRVYSKDLREMDFLCTEFANVFAKEVDLIAHQARAHDTGHFTCTECQAFLVGKVQHRNHTAHEKRKVPIPSPLDNVPL